MRTVNWLDVLGLSFIHSYFCVGNCLLKKAFSEVPLVRRRSIIRNEFLFISFYVLLSNVTWRTREHFPLGFQLHIWWISFFFYPTYIRAYVTAVIRYSGPWCIYFYPWFDCNVAKSRGTFLSIPIHSTLTKYLLRLPSVRIWICSAVAIQLIVRHSLFSTIWIEFFEWNTSQNWSV